MSTWLLYGANGYTGRLIAEEAANRDLKPVLAGRSADKIRPIAEKLDLPWRSFGLGGFESAVQELRDCDLVLHCAGPFSATAEPMMRACLEAGTHYLDITGEIAVFELAHSLDNRAKAANIVLCPGVGFDVIPTDCVAARLHYVMPEATHLALGFDSRGGFSPGTAKTSVEGLALGGRVREDGEITTVPLAYKSRRIDFGDGEKLAVTIPWGDVATAYYTTGIPNIETYIPTSSRMLRRMRMFNSVRRLLGTRIVQQLMKRRIEKTVRGPSAQKRASLKTYVWGEASNDVDEKYVARIEVANGYALTVTGSLAVVDYVLSNKVKGGYYTPSQLAGVDLVRDLPGSGELMLTQES